jgi:hypothetical protein
MTSFPNTENEVKMSNVEGRSLLDELKKFDGQTFFDWGHPLLNRITESFVKAAGIGAVQAVSRDSYYTAAEGFEKNNSQEIGRYRRKTRFPNFEGETYKKSLETLVKRTGKESMQWGLAASMYSGVTYTLKEVRGGAHDWKNAAVAGAFTGATLALTNEELNYDHIVQGAIAGAALSTAANVLNKML